MYRYRLIYAITLATALSFYIVYSPWFSWFLLVFVLLLAPLDLIISLPGMRAKSIKLSAPPFLESSDEGKLTLTTMHNKPFPVRCLYVKLYVFGDDFAARCSVLVPAGSVNRGEVEIDTDQTGLTVFKVRRLYAVSLLGLFSLKIKCSDKASVLVLPPPEKPPNTLALPQGLILKPKPGGGFSEEHDMRAYQPGDPIRSVHWKLSAKLDSLIIREPLIPPQQSRLVQLMPWENAAQRDSALARLRWVSDYMLKKGLAFHVKFGDRQLIEEITSEEDLINFLRRALDRSGIMKSAQYPRLTRFSWVFKIAGDGEEADNW